MSNQTEQTEQWEDDKRVYVPMEMIRDFENIFSLMKEVRQEFYKVAAAMKPAEN